MRETDRDIDLILNHLAEARGLDFSGCHADMLVQQIRRRLAATACKDLCEYLACLQCDAAEQDHLIDAMTVNVSRFFRDALTFELLAVRVLPDMVRRKAGARNATLRVWSAGCARGEEPYSVAILLRELLEQDRATPPLHLFATDIDQRALQEAREARYPLSSVEHMPHRLLTKYLTPEGDCFRLNPDVRATVHFSFHDMLDKRCAVPPESVFGAFDLVLCRNLLIYFNPEYQARIFAKLHRALARNGCLVLGEAEAPPATLRHRFQRLFDSSPIYRKRQKGESEA